MELNAKELSLLESVNLDEMESYEPIVTYGIRNTEPEVRLSVSADVKKIRNDLTFNLPAVRQMKFKQDQFCMAFKFGVPGLLIIIVDPPKDQPQFKTGNRKQGDKAIKFSNKLFVEEIMKHFDIKPPRIGKLLTAYFELLEYHGKFVLRLKNQKTT